MVSIDQDFIQTLVIYQVIKQSIRRHHSIFELVTLNSYSVYLLPTNTLVFGDKASLDLAIFSLKYSFSQAGLFCSHILPDLSLIQSPFDCLSFRSTFYCFQAFIHSFNRYSFIHSFVKHVEHLLYVKLYR